MHRGNFPWISPVPFCLADKFKLVIPIYTRTMTFCF